MSMLDDILAGVTGGGGGGGDQNQIDTPYMQQALLRGLVTMLATQNAPMMMAAMRGGKTPGATVPAGDVEPPQPQSANRGTMQLGAPRPQTEDPAGGEAAPMPTYGAPPRGENSLMSLAGPSRVPAQTYQPSQAPSPIRDITAEEQAAPQPPAAAPQSQEPPATPVQTVSVSPQQMPQRPLNASAPQPPVQPQPQTPPGRSPNISELFPKADFGPNVLERIMGTVLGAPGDTTWLPGGGRDQLARQQSSTVQALIAKGIDPGAAEAAARNPDIMRQLAPVIFGAKQNAEWKPIGNDKYGQQQYGWVNPNTQEVRDSKGNLIGSPNAPGAPAQSGPDVSGLQGKELLDALDPGDRNQVQAILDGRQAPPSPNARNARTQRINEWVAQAEPGFDMTTWKARNTLRTEMASTKPGTAGGSIIALDTAMSHMDRLQKSADALDNWTFPGSTLLRSGVTNPIARNLEGTSSFNEREAAYNTDRKAVLDEAAKVFAGTSTVFDRKSWEEKLNATQTIGQQNAVIKELVGLMKGRVEAIAQASNRTLGGNKTPYDFIAPTTASKMQKILGEQ